jgi:hypothetical protein
MMDGGGRIDCPICFKPFTSLSINAHVELCLNKANKTNTTTPMNTTTNIKKRSYVHVDAVQDISHDKPVSSAPNPILNSNATHKDHPSTIQKNSLNKIPQNIPSVSTQNAALKTIFSEPSLNVANHDESRADFQHNNISKVLFIHYSKREFELNYVGYIRK